MPPKRPERRVPAGHVHPEAVAWEPSYRIIAARYGPVGVFDRAADPADVDRDLELASFTDSATARVRDAYRSLPNEDRLSGSGSGLLMPSFVFPAYPSRFANGARGGTYYAANDEETAKAETLYHFSHDVEAATDALREALRRGEMPRREVQVIAADVHGSFLDVRRVPRPFGGGDVYLATGEHDKDYVAGQALEARVRVMPVDGVLYRSVRRPKASGTPAGECLAVYRPRALRNGRALGRLVYEWRAPGVAVVV